MGNTSLFLPLLHQQSFHQFYQHLCLSRAMKQTKHQDTQTLNMAGSCGWILVRPTELKRDLFKKISDTKGTFHAKIGSIKYRNGRDLTEAEDIKKRWQEYTEQLYKKDLHERKRVRKRKGYIFPFLLCLLSQIITMVWSLTWSQTSWNVKSSGP